MHLPIFVKISPLHRFTSFVTTDITILSLQNNSSLHSNKYLNKLTDLPIFLKIPLLNRYTIFETTNITLTKYRIYLQ